jgi:hypothetical protein
LSAWHITSTLPDQIDAAGGGVTWFVGGSREQWQGSPIVLVIVLEANNPEFANRIGREILAGILVP